jgi:hypothetical protein
MYFRFLNGYYSFNDTASWNEHDKKVASLNWNAVIKSVFHVTFCVFAMKSIVLSIRQGCWQNPSFAPPTLTQPVIPGDRITALYEYVYWFNTDTDYDSNNSNALFCYRKWNFKISDSAASGPVWLVQTGLGLQTVKDGLLMGQHRLVYVGRHMQPVWWQVDLLRIVGIHGFI